MGLAAYINPATKPTGNAVLTFITSDENVAPLVSIVTISNTTDYFTHSTGAGGRKISIKCRGDYALRMKTGVAGEYITIPSGQSYNLDFTDGGIPATTLYFACPTSTTVVEILEWI